MTTVLVTGGAGFIATHTDIELLNRQRESVLDVAAAASQLAALDYLVKAGANLDLAGRR